MFNKNNFIKFLIEEKVMLFGNFVTKSKRKSPYFLNFGEIKRGEGIRKLGCFYANHISNLIKEKKIKKRDLTLFGPAYKGIPLSIAAAEELSKKLNSDVFWSFNRKEKKDHGEGGIFVGKKISKEDNIIVVDDVITAGTAIKEVSLLLKKTALAKINALVISVDRMEKGAGSMSAVEEIEKSLKIKVFPMITILDILNYLKKNKDKKNVKKIEEYLREYGSETVAGAIE